MAELNEIQLRRFLRTERMGRCAEFHRELDSTNIRGKEVADDRRRHGALIVAEQQTAGRGRMDRVWHSPRGRNLYLSLVLFPQVPSQTIPQIAILTAIALHQALAQIMPDHALGLKWPNDLWSSEGRKLSGILCESVCCGRQISVVAGIGINVNGTREDFPPELRDTAGTLQEVAGHELDRAQVLGAFLNAFEPLFTIWEQVATLQPFLEYWNDFDILRGKDIELDVQDKTISGTVIETMPDGRLLLDCQGKKTCVHAGDTHLRH